MMRLRSAALRVVGLGLSLGLLGACQNQNVRFSPPDGKSDVPVNAAVRVQYISETPIREADLREENFTLAPCDGAPAANPAGTTGATAADENGANPEPSPTPNAGSVSPSSGQSASPIRTRVVKRSYDVVRTYKNDGRREKLRGTHILLVPIPMDFRDPPLKADQQYCFSTPEVRDEDGRVFPAQTITFRTEAEPKFFFSRSNLRVTHRRPEKAGEREDAEFAVNPQDLVIVEFDKPVHPDDVAATKLCISYNTERTTVTRSNDPGSESECYDLGGGDFAPTGASYYLLESFGKPEDEILTATFTRYGIRGGRSKFLSDRDYVAIVGLTEGDDVSGDVEIDFGVDEDLKPTLSTDVLKEPVSEILLRESN